MQLLSKSFILLTLCRPVGLLRYTMLGRWLTTAPRSANQRTMPFVGSKVHVLFLYFIVSSRTCWWKVELDGSYWISSLSVLSMQLWRASWRRLTLKIKHFTISCLQASASLVTGVSTSTRRRLVGFYWSLSEKVTTTTTPWKEGKTAAFMIALRFAARGGRKKKQIRELSADFGAKAKVAKLRLGKISSRFGSTLPR